jgi:cytochrome b involved in lipid metabolism
MTRSAKLEQLWAAPPLYHIVSAGEDCFPQYPARRAAHARARAIRGHVQRMHHKHRRAQDGRAVIERHTYAAAEEEIGGRAGVELNFTAAEVRAHRTPESCWLTIGGMVFDVTGFLAEHPGGAKLLLRYGGQDVTNLYRSLHGPSVLGEFAMPLLLGRVVEERHGATDDEHDLSEVLAIIAKLDNIDDALDLAKYEGIDAVTYAGLDLAAMQVLLSTHFTGGTGRLPPPPGVAVKAEPSQQCQQIRGSLPDPEANGYLDIPDQSARDPKELFASMPRFPKALRWLTARWVPGPVLPISLRPLSATAGHGGGTGLMALTPRHWLEYDEARFAPEVAMKKKLLVEGSPHYNTVFQAEPDSGPEQEELLELLVAHIKEHMPERYSFDGDTITVLETGDNYRLSDYVGKCDAAGSPLAMLLAAKLVQEEFFILRRQGTLEEFKQGDVEPYQYVFIAGSAAINLVFSGIRGERNEFKLGSPMHRIHARVPGMEEQGWHPRLAHIFSGVTDEQPFYRTNWTVLPHNRSTHYLTPDGDYASAEDVKMAYGNGGGDNNNLKDHWAKSFATEAENMFVAAEFQCLHRLPRTKALVFTIHKYFSPMVALRSLPRAADMMARSFAEKSEQQLNYTLSADVDMRRKVMIYLAECADVGGKTLSEHLDAQTSAL